MNDKSAFPFRILIVEDDEDLRGILKLLLEHRFEAEVLEASDGEAAVELAQSEGPDLILMDLVLPKMGGLSAISIITTTLSTEHIPIIVVSDHCWDPSVVERSQASGSLECVDKAHLMEELLPLVDSVLAT